MQDSLHDALPSKEFLSHTAQPVDALRRSSHSLPVCHALASLRNRVVDVVCSGLPVFCSVLGKLIDAFGLPSARRKVGEITRRPAYFKHCCILLRNLNQMCMHAKLLRMAKQQEPACEAQNNGNFGGNQTLVRASLSYVKHEVIIRLSSAITCQTASQPACVPRPREPPQSCCGCHLLRAAGVLFSSGKINRCFRLTICPTKSGRNHKKTCILQTLLHPPQKPESDVHACQTTSDGEATRASMRSSKQWKFRWKSNSRSCIPIICQTRSHHSAVFCYYMPNCFAACVCATPSQASTIVLWMSFAQGCRCFVQFWEN